MTAGAAAGGEPDQDVPPQPDGVVPGYEAARAELEQVVARLESGGATLEESLALWERGEQLAAVCLRWLDGAQARLEAARPDEE